MTHSPLHPIQRELQTAQAEPWQPLTTLGEQGLCQGRKSLEIQVVMN
jgi:hypothetical protein